MGKRCERFFSLHCLRTCILLVMTNYKERLLLGTMPLQKPFVTTLRKCLWLLGLGGRYTWENLLIGRLHKAVTLKKEVERVNLWLDSTDAPMEGKERIRRFSSKWSYKCAGPARRYMVLSDAKGRIRKIWGGYSLKIYDGHLVEANKDWFEDKLKGAEVVAD